MEKAAKLLQEWIDADIVEKIVAGRNWYDDDSANPGAAMGSLHSVGGPLERTRVDALYDVAEKIARCNLRPQKPPMRFK